MKQHRIVVVLGGNALGDTPDQQAAAAEQTARVIADLVSGGHQVIVSHGNGPQVGLIQNAMTALAEEEPRQGETPLFLSGAMSQGYIGFDLQNALRRALQQQKLDRSVCTVLTQCAVDPEDPAFQNPTKPIGRHLSAREAKEVARKTGYLMKEDAGRGYRRYVPSPLPRQIVEKDSIRTLWDHGSVVICCGGGGVPVVPRDGGWQGVDAVIDKDFAAALLAEELDADLLVILTAVEKVAINFRRPDQQWLTNLTPEQAAQYEAQGHFAAGSMLPKVQAAAKFAASRPGRRAVITLPELAAEGIAGTAGTSVQMAPPS